MLSNLQNDNGTAPSPEGEGRDEVFSSLHLNAPPILFKNAKILRQEMTESEKVLWNQLRNRKLGGYKFRRQHPILNYIADFYCHEYKLIVEVDGSVHNNSDQAEYDQFRTTDLAQIGIKVLRFTNNEVLKELEKVLKQINDFLNTHSTI